MNKILALCLIAVLLGLTQAVDTECAKHPILKRLKRFAEMVKDKQESTADSEALQTKITEFASHTPAADATMVKCDAYKDEDTCCTKAFTDMFPKIMKASFKKRMMVRPKVLGAIKKIAMSTAECKGKEAAQKFMEDMKPNVEAFQKCRLQGLKGEINWQRGTLCAICKQPADYATIFEGYTDGSDTEKHKLKVTEESANKYQAAIDASADCFNEKVTAFRTQLKTWAEENLSGCTELEGIIAKMLEDKENDVEKPDCKASGMLGGGCLRHQEDSEDRKKMEGGGTGDRTGDRTGDGTRTAGRRILQETEETEYQTDAAGVNAYQEDTTMDAEFDTLHGEQKFDEEMGDLPEKKDGVDEDEASDSNASVLAISAMLAIVLALI